jgi:hypothetical protein
VISFRSLSFSPFFFNQSVTMLPQREPLIAPIKAGRIVSISKLSETIRLLQMELWFDYNKDITILNIYVVN